MEDETLNISELEILAGIGLAMGNVRGNETIH